MGGVLANVKVKSTFVEYINAKKFKDKRFNALQNKVIHGEMENYKLQAREMLWFNRRLYVHRVGDLIHDALLEAYVWHYSIH